MCAAFVSRVACTMALASESHIVPCNSEPIAFIGILKLENESKIVHVSFLFCAVFLLRATPVADSDIGKPSRRDVTCLFVRIRSMRILRAYLSSMSLPTFSDVISIWRLYLPGVEPGISRWLAESIPLGRECFHQLMKAFTA